MKKVRVLAVTLVLALVVAIPAAFAQSTPEEMGLISIRTFFEDLGADVDWQHADRSIHIAMDGGTMILFADRTLAYANDVALTLQDGVSLQQNRALISEDDLVLLHAAFLETLSVEATTLTFYLTEEARDIVLEDFDYMVNAILENSPWESVLDRVVFYEEGVSFEFYVSHFREYIEAMNPIPVTVPDEAVFRSQFPIKEGDDARAIAANYLFALLNFEFAPPLMNIGHLGPRTLDMYTSLLTAFSRQYHNPALDSENNLVLALFLEAYTHPSAVWFYGDIEVDLDGVIQASFPDVPGNIVTEILVPDEVAFLRINSFLANPIYDDLVTLPFLQEVQDYNHLILDLRGNLGGLVTYFDEFILGRLISEPVEIGVHEFFSEGDRAYGLMDAYLQSRLEIGSIFEWSELVSVEIVPAVDFITDRGMTHFNQDDLALLDYVLLSRTVTFPAGDSINFDGKVWLLVDAMSMSASALATNTMLYTGVATVVGENTSGVMGSQHRYITLPNTGIIWRIDIGYQTDALGNSLEVYGIAPQIRNFDGMDALETVLELIAQGNY